MSRLDWLDGLHLHSAIFYVCSEVDGLGCGCCDRKYWRFLT
ncbi:MAG: hypothetical protein ACYSWW_02390 [Planctomycetota bacterium]